MTKPDSKANWMDNLCPVCHGTGHRPQIRRAAPGKKITPAPCAACGGTGRKAATSA